MLGPKRGAFREGVETNALLERAVSILGRHVVQLSRACRGGTDVECLKLVELLIVWHDSTRYRSRIDLPTEFATQIQPSRLIETVVLGCVGSGTNSCPSLVELALYLKPGIHLFDRIELLGAQVPALEAKCRSEIGAACLILGHLNGSEELARSYLHRACDTGHSEGCLLAGISDYMAFLQTEQASDLQMASEAMEFACAENRLLACEFLQNLSRQ